MTSRARKKRSRWSEILVVVGDVITLPFRIIGAVFSAILEGVGE